MKRFFQRFIGRERSKYIDTEEKVYLPKEFGTTILHFACANNIEDVIEDILDERIDVNTIDNFGFTPLHLACEVGTSNIVRILLREGANPNILTSKGETALYIACDKGNIEIARMLLQYGANASIGTVNGDTPLNVACKCRNVELARLLLDNNAVQDGEGRVDMNPLRYACENGDLNMMELLLERIPGLSVDRALHWACEGRNYYLIEALLNRGANVNALDAFGQTPLRVACNRKMFGMAKLFIEKGANVNISDMFGVTPLKAVVRSFREVSLIQMVDMFDIIRLLIDNFADLSALSTKKDDKLVSMLLEDSNVRVRTRVALHVRDVDWLRHSLFMYYNQYKPNYDNPIKKDLSNLSEVRDNLAQLEDMMNFVKKLKISREYMHLKRKLAKMSDNIDTNVKKCIKDMINEVDRFCENVNNLRNTKVIESIVLPICKAKRPKDRHQLTN